MKRYNNKMNNTQPNVRIGFYNPKNKRQDIVRNVQKAHFMLGTKDTSKNIQDSQIQASISSNNEQFQNHLLDPKYHYKEMSKLKQVSKSMRRANFRLSDSTQFYDRTMNQTYMDSKDEPGTSIRKVQSNDRK